MSIRRSKDLVQSTLAIRSGRRYAVGILFNLMGHGQRVVPETASTRCFAQQPTSQGSCLLVRLEIRRVESVYLQDPSDKP